MSDVQRCFRVDQETVSSDCGFADFLVEVREDGWRRRGWPSWLQIAFGATWIAVGLAFAVTNLVLVRSWGAKRPMPPVVVLLFAVYAAGFAAPIGSPDTREIAAAVRIISLIAMVWISRNPDRVARLLPRGPEWDVLHRLSAITAKAEPLTQEEVRGRAPEFLAMIEDAEAYLTKETAEYLDLFEEQARSDLGVGPVPADAEGLDQRWQELHARLASRFAPLRTWFVEPPRSTKAGAG